MEEEILAGWEERQVFEAVTKARAGGPSFNFYEGPPTANGAPGIHHVLGRTLKDTACRYRSMQGHRVERRAGWDTHGLPVEIEVERELGLRDRQAIEDYGIAPYNRACRASVLRHKRDWDRLTRRIGYWVDLEHPYMTLDTDYIESVWWLIKQVHLKGLLYRGSKIQWYSPASGTILSSHEVNLGYREVEDPSVFVRFPLQDGEGAFLAWTTTPWTLPANAALAVRPDAVYIEAEHGGERLWLAETRLETLGKDCRILQRRQGADLVGRLYRPPYSPGNTGAASRRVLAADFVDCDEGTGIVHIAPNFGEDDHRLGLEHNLPALLPVDEQGRFTDALPFLKGQWFKDADPLILKDLGRRGLLFRRASIRHNYPHDWRRETPLMNYPMPGWFLRTTAIRERLVELNRTVRWYPETIGSGRFGDWLEHNVDWALSRRRYWGTPMPIWSAEGPGPEYYEVIGSIEELRAKCPEQLPPGAPVDLHRPGVDEFHWRAPDGRPMRRIPEVLDVWFDSGAMPFAQWHYPFENKQHFERNFPADFIAEGLDQTRGWFYTLHAIATAIMDRPAYRSVLVNGLVLDARGEKMSKSKGNTIAPMEILKQHGADVLRWYMISNSLPWENMRFRPQALGELRRRFYGTLENLYSFLASYANIDGFHHQYPPLPVAQRKELDRWILSRLHGTLQEVTRAFEDYRPTHAARAIEQFTEDLSNWYLRRSRRRFWRAGRLLEGKEHDQDKLAAYQTLSECLHHVALMMAPVSPFFAEWLYRNLKTGTKESVHLEDFPAPNTQLQDPKLEQRMTLARGLVSAVLQLRNNKHIKVRQPLQRILVEPRGPVEQAAIEQTREIIKEEVNVQDIQYHSPGADLLHYRVKPVYARLGPRLGPLMNPLQAELEQLRPRQIRDYLQRGRLTLHIRDQELTLKTGDLEISAHSKVEDLAAAHTGELLVALDTRITPELYAAGLAREAIHRIQQLRKDMNLQLTDRIQVQYHATDLLQQAMQQHQDRIRKETLATQLHPAPHPEGTLVQNYRIDREQLTIAVTLQPAPAE